MSPRAGRSTRPVWTSVAASPQHTARFHRERDRRRLRAMMLSLACAGFLVALVLAVVGLRVQQVRMSYRLDGLRAARAEMEETRGQLRVELATLRSLARIEGRARTELGMVTPGPDQVRLAREFVPGGPGLASRSPLTASVSAPRPGEAGIR